MIKERIRLFIVKYRKLIIFVICLIIILLIILNYNVLLKIKIPSEGFAVLGTLLGAVVGGIFTLFGSVYVSKKQIRVRSDVNRINVIYKPLFDELQKNHNEIKLHNPFPDKIEFSKGEKTMIQNPQYILWDRIKMDSRYLEVPKYLEKRMEYLYGIINEYNQSIDNIKNLICDLITHVLTEKNINMKRQIYANNSFVTDLLCQIEKDYFNYDTFMKHEFKEESNESLSKISSIIYSECEKIPEIAKIREERQEWLKEEEKILKWLEIKIRITNIEYGG